MKREFAAGLICMVAAAAALAHEGEDPLAQWYRSLSTADGQSCCEMRDCAPADARLTDHGWEVLVVPWEVAPRWVRVPEEAVLHRFNPDGRPILCRTPNGFIRCFVPPAGS